jgi:hypothetical protein
VLAQLVPLVLLGPVQQKLQAQ